MDDTDFNYRDATFPTAIDSVVESEADSLRLPEVVNFVALRETCLSEAPFVNRNNRKFWKKWMDSPQYVTILCATLKILLENINDVGTVDVQGLYNMTDSPLVNQMSMCIAEMLVLDKKRFSRAHDNLFRKLPELLCYMLVNSLHSCNPRQSRVFNAVKFRELLLDWLGELVGGIRMTNCQSERKWLFTDPNVIETPITLVNDMVLTTMVPKIPRAIKKRDTLNSTNMSSAAFLPPLEEQASTKSQGNGGWGTAASSPVHLGATRAGFNGTFNTLTTGPPGTAGTIGSQVGGTGNVGAGMSTGVMSARSNGVSNVAGKGGATCHFSVGNSPLVNIYMNLGRSPLEPVYACAHPVKLVLTTQPDRPLTSLTPDGLLKAGGFREKVIYPDQLNRVLKNSCTNRKQILRNLDLERLQLRRDMNRIDETLKLQYKALERSAPPGVLSGSSSMSALDKKSSILGSGGNLEAAVKFNIQSNNSVGTNERD